MELPDLSALPDWLEYPLTTLLVLSLTYASVKGALRLSSDAKATKEPSADTPATIDLTEPFMVLVTRVKDMEKRLGESEVREEVQKIEIERLKDDLQDLRGVFRRLVGVFTREVAAVVEWFQRGANPPTPDEELVIIRQILQELNTDKH